MTLRDSTVRVWRCRRRREIVWKDLEIPVRSVWCLGSYWASLHSNKVYDVPLSNSILFIVTLVANLLPLLLLGYMLVMSLI